MATLQGWATVPSGNNTKAASQNGSTVSYANTVSTFIIDSSSKYIGFNPCSNDVATATGFSIFRSSATSYNYVHSAFLTFNVATSNKSVVSLFEIGVYAIPSRNNFTTTANDISSRWSNVPVGASAIIELSFDVQGQSQTQNIDITNLVQTALIASTSTTGNTAHDFIVLIKYYDSTSSYVTFDMGSASLITQVAKTRTLNAGTSPPAAAALDWNATTTWTTGGGTLPTLLYGNVPEQLDLVQANAGLNPNLTISTSTNAVCRNLNFSNYNNTGGNIIFRIEGNLTVGISSPSTNNVASTANIRPGNNIAFSFPAQSNGTYNRTLSVVANGAGVAPGNISFNFYKILDVDQTITFGALATANTGTMTPSFAESFDATIGWKNNVISFTGGRYVINDAIFGRNTGTLSNNPRLSISNSYVNFKNNVYYLNRLYSDNSSLQFNNASGRARFNLYKNCPAQKSGHMTPSYDTYSTNVITTIATPTPYPEIWVYGGNGSVNIDHPAFAINYEPLSTTGTSFLNKNPGSNDLNIIQGRLDSNGYLTNAYQTYTGNVTITGTGVSADTNLNYIQANAVAQTNLMCFIKSTHSISGFGAAWTQIASKSFNDGTQALYTYVLMKTMQGGTADNLVITSSNANAQHLVKFWGNITFNISDLAVTKTYSRAAGEASVTEYTQNVMDYSYRLQFFASADTTDNYLMGTGSIIDYNSRIYTSYDLPSPLYITYDNNDGTYSDYPNNYSYNTTYNAENYQDGWNENDWASIFIYLEFCTPPIVTEALNIKHSGTGTSFYSFVMGDNVTVTNTMNLLGTNNTLQISSSVRGSQRIWQNTPTTTIKNVNFQDQKFNTPITYSATNTRLGDCEGNTNITFTPAVNKYWVSNGGNATGSWNTTATTWPAGARWSDTSGGAVNADIPLPQDTAIFDNNSGIGTVTINSAAVCGIQCNNPFAITFTNATHTSFIYGDVNLASNSTINNTTIPYVLRKRSGQIFNFNNATNNITKLVIDNGVFFVDSSTIGNVIIRNTNSVGNTYAFNSSIVGSQLNIHSGKVQIEGDISVGSFTNIEPNLQGTIGPPCYLVDLINPYSNIILKGNITNTGNNQLYFIYNNQLYINPIVNLNNANITLSDTSTNDNKWIEFAYIPNNNINNYQNIFINNLILSGENVQNANTFIYSNYVNLYIKNMKITGSKIIWGSTASMNIYVENIDIKSTNTNKVSFYYMVLTRPISGGIWYLPWTDLQNCVFQSKITSSPGVAVYAPNSTDTTSSTANAPAKLFYTKVPYPGVLTLPRTQNPRSNSPNRSNFI